METFRSENQLNFVSSFNNQKFKNMSNQKVWFITGASKGIGLQLTQLLLSKGDKVAATSRSVNSFKSQITENTANFLPLELDIASDQKVKEAVQKTVDTFGHIDVAVNNAGYLLLGSLEELTDTEFRQALDVNLFGAVNVIRAVTPFMRNQKSGHIINISSGAGYFGDARASTYNASKFALIGITEALSKEVSGFGIKATVLAPGVFRTSFLDASSSMQITSNLIPEYKTQEMLNGFAQYNGFQPGDPNKLVNIINDIASLEKPPLHLLLGTDVYKWVTDKHKADNEEFEVWKHLTLSTDFSE